MNKPNCRTIWPWSQIERDYKTVDEGGNRWVLVWHNTLGTILVPWRGTED